MCCNPPPGLALGKNTKPFPKQTLLCRDLIKCWSSSCGLDSSSKRRVYILFQVLAYKGFPPLVLLGSVTGIAFFLSRNCYRLKSEWRLISLTLSAQNVRSVGVSPTKECLVIDVRSAQAKRISYRLCRRAKKFVSLARRLKQGE